MATVDAVDGAVEVEVRVVWDLPWSPAMSGSSRDWAAKGAALLGVRAVIAESYERIHRSNLIGMGVLPLQFPDSHSADSLGLTGEETVEIAGIDGFNPDLRQPTGPF